MVQIKREPTVPATQAFKCLYIPYGSNKTVLEFIKEYPIFALYPIWFK